MGAKMKEIGLQPSDTGEPGGKEAASIWGTTSLWAGPWAWSKRSGHSPRRAAYQEALRGQGGDICVMLAEPRSKLRRPSTRARGSILNVKPSI